MKKLLFTLLVTTLTAVSSYAQCLICGGGGFIDGGQFNLGVSTSINPTAISDVQTGLTVDGRTDEAFARIRFGIVYLKGAYSEGKYSQLKLERFYTNQFWSYYGEIGLQTSPDYLTFGDLGLWGQAGINYGRMGAKVTNHLIDADQILTNVGPYWGYTFGAGLEYDGMFAIGKYEISPAVVIERMRQNFFEDFTWDGINGGVANDAVKGWRVSLMIRFGSW